MFIPDSGCVKIATTDDEWDHPYHFSRSGDSLWAVSRSNGNGILHTSADNGKTWTVAFNYGQCSNIAIREGVVAVSSDFQVLTALVETPGSLTIYAFPVPLNGVAPTLLEYRPPPAPGAPPGPPTTVWYGKVRRAIPFPEGDGCFIMATHSNAGIMQSGYVLFKGSVESYTIPPPSGLSNTAIFGIAGHGGDVKVLINDYDPFHSGVAWDAILNKTFQEEGRVNRANYSASTRWEGFGMGLYGVSAAIPYTANLISQPQGIWQQGLSTAPVKIDDMRSGFVTPISDTLSSGEESVRCTQGEVNGTLTIALVDPIMTFSYVWGDNDTSKSIGSHYFANLKRLWMPPSNPVFGLGIHVTESDNTKALYWVYDMSPHVIKSKPNEYYTEPPPGNINHPPGTPGDPGTYPFHSGSIPSGAINVMQSKYIRRVIDRW
jgi:hypothetical protein